MGMNRMGMNQMGMMNQMNNLNQMAALNQMNMAQMNQQNAPNQGNNQNTQEYLTIFFVIFDGQSKEIAIQCTFTEKVEDVINRYRAKTGDNDKTD